MRILGQPCEFHLSERRPASRRRRCSSARTANWALCRRTMRGGSRSAADVQRAAARHAWSGIRSHDGPWSGAWAQVGPGASTARARPSITPPGQFSLSQYCISSLIPPYRPPYNNETEPDHKTEGNCPRSGRACWSCSRGGCAPRGAPGTRSRVTGSSCDYECVRNTI